MKLHQHEKWIKSNIEGLENSVDSNALWADLKEYVPKKKKSRKGIVIFFTGFAVLFSVILICVLNPSFEQKEGNSEIKVIHQKNEIQNIDFAKVKSPIVNNDLPLKINSIDNNSIKKSSKRSGIITNENTLSGLQLDPTDNINESFIPIIKNDAKSKINSMDLVSSSFGSIGSTVNSLLSDFSNPNSKDGILEKENFNNSFEKNSSIKFHNKDIKETIINEPANLTFLESARFSMLSNELLLKELALNDLIKRKKSKISLGLIQGFNYKNDVFQSSNVEYNELYNSISTDLVGNFSSIFLQYSFTDKWSLWTSLNFNQSVTRLTYEFEKRTTETTQGIRQYVIGTDNSTSEFSGEIISHNIIKANGTWHEFENNIDNSVVLQYSLWNKNRIQAKIGAGIDLSIYSKLRGSSLDHNAENYVINSNQTIKYKSSIINPIYLFQLDYRLTPKYSIGVIGLFTTKNRYIDHIYNSSFLKRTSYNIGLSCNYIL